jgi:hypothetical protein
MGSRFTASSPARVENRLRRLRLLAEKREFPRQARRCSEDLFVSILLTNPQRIGLTIGTSRGTYSEHFL